MNPWIEGILYTTLLAAGAAAGWLAGQRLRLRLPNAPMMAAVLAGGVLAGTFLSARLLGPGVIAHSVAMLVAGGAVGLAFWPMRERPGERKWP